MNLLKSVTGEALNQELINLTTLATDFEEVYLNTFVENLAKSSAVLEKIPYALCDRARKRELRSYLKPDKGTVKDSHS